MFYSKNLPVWERLLRVFAGLGMVFLGLLALRGLLSGYLVAASGLGVIATGFFGFCPMCAMVGRKLDKRSP